ncbi:MAG: hypothetical protein ABIF18_03915 [archaeon]
MALKKNGRYPALTAIIPLAMIIIILLLVFLWLGGSYSINDDALSVELDVTDLNKKATKSYFPEGGIIKYQDDDDDETCEDDSDCGTDGFIDNYFCSVNNVWQNYRVFTCEDPGEDSSCSQTITPTLITTCDNTCASGTCIPATCNNDSDCDDSDVYTLDTCNNPGTDTSSCTYENITCNSDSDCDDSDTSTLDTCSFPGTTNSSCAYEHLPADLNLIFHDTVYELRHNVLIDGINYPNVHYYTHNRTFEETNGVGVNLTFGRLCFDSASDCNTANVTYRIDASDELIKYEKNFWTTRNSEIFYLTYWGTDDNGNAIEISQNMCTEGSTFTENC